MFDFCIENIGGFTTNVRFCIENVGLRRTYATGTRRCCKDISTVSSLAAAAASLASPRLKLKAVFLSNRISAGLHVDKAQRPALLQAATYHQYYRDPYESSLYGSSRSSRSSSWRRPSRSMDLVDHPYYRDPYESPRPTMELFTDVKVLDTLIPTLQNIASIVKKATPGIFHYLRCSNI